MYKVGIIVNTHGLQGEVKVKRVSDFEERFDVGNTLYIKKADDSIQAVTIKRARTQKNVYIILFNEFSTIDDVLPLKGETLYITDEQLTPLEEHEFYYHEIIGCTMYTTDGEKIGIVDSILSPGANDVWVVKGENSKEYLIPYIEDVVKDVNVKDKNITIELMEGLIE